MNVNTSAGSRVTNAEIERQMQAQTVAMKQIFADSPRRDIRIPTREGSKDQTVEGGTNGYFWKLQRGVIIRDVALPILDTLDEAGIEYSKESEIKFPQQAAAKPARAPKQSQLGDETPSM